LAFHPRIPQHAMISGTTFGWSACTMPPDAFGATSFSKLSPGPGVQVEHSQQLPTVELMQHWPALQHIFGAFEVQMQNFQQMNPVMHIACKRCAICHVQEISNASPFSALHFLPRAVSISTPFLPQQSSL
jgi:hypothetical protein